ncbi:MAG: type IV toxin-antitoxin system AbiEi family antitoxin [Candidatus Odinarchaeia archaeon]
MSYVKINEIETKRIFLQKIEDLLPEVEIRNIITEQIIANEKADIIIKIKIGKLKKTLICEVKSKGEARYIYQAIAKIKSMAKIIENSIPVIVAPHIGERGKEIAHEFNVGYIDLTGNMWLKINNITIEKEGEKIKKREYRLAKNIFAKKSSRILKALLIEYNKHWRLEELAEITKTSISYVHRVIKTLEKMGYIKYKKREGIKLTRAEALLLDWSKHYNIIEDTDIQSYYTFTRESSEIIKQIKNVSTKSNLKYALTLFSASQLILPYVRQTGTYVYFDTKDIETWVEKLGLHTVEAGANFFVVKPFDEHVYWGIQKIGGVKIVSNIQLFLDLYNFPSRGREQALALKNKKIKFM